MRPIYLPWGCGGSLGPRRMVGESCRVQSCSRDASFLGTLGPQATAVPFLLRSSSKENTAFPAGVMRGSFWQDLGLGQVGRGACEKVQGWHLTAPTPHLLLSPPAPQPPNLPK